MFRFLCVIFFLIIIHSFPFRLTIEAMKNNKNNKISFSVDGKKNKIKSARTHTIATRNVFVAFFFAVCLISTFSDEYRYEWMRSTKANGWNRLAKRPIHKWKWVLLWVCASARLIYVFQLFHSSVNRQVTSFACYCLLIKGLFEITAFRVIFFHYWKKKSSTRYFLFRSTQAKKCKSELGTN